MWTRPKSDGLKLLFSKKGSSGVLTIKVVTNYHQHVSGLASNGPTFQMIYEEHFYFRIKKKVMNHTISDTMKNLLEMMSFSRIKFLPPINELRMNFERLHQRHTRKYKRFWGEASSEIWVLNSDCWLKTSTLIEKELSSEIQFSWHRKEITKYGRGAGLIFYNSMVSGIL